jgi:hypothetical protein
VLLGCSVYSGEVADPASTCGNSRLDDGETCDRAIRAGERGACPATCDDDDPCAPMVRRGTGCHVECVAMPPDDDAGCGECGDLAIDADETCDPPDSCETPEDCVTSAQCMVAVYSGQPGECTARCAFEPLTECIDDDACCPPGCRFETDADCPNDCGDGVVDASAGETCDPGDPSSSCDESCDDDDPCTVDEAAGSAKLCNVRCSHDPITSAGDDDGCCPPGIDETEDSDCAGICAATGDDPADPDAACAGASGADPSDDDEPSPPDQISDDGDGDDEPSPPDQTSDDSDGEPSPPDQTSDGDEPSSVPAAVQQCREILTSSGDPASAECAECVCDHCEDLMRGCYLDGDAQRNAGCSEIMQCKQRAGCVGGDCYCGDSRSCLLPNGPCVDEIDDAPGPGTPLSICIYDPGCANYWAAAYTECLERNCTGPCR